MIVDRSRASMLMTVVEDGPRLHQYINATLTERRRVRHLSSPSLYAAFSHALQQQLSHPLLHIETADSHATTTSDSSNAERDDSHGLESCSRVSPLPRFSNARLA